MISNETLELLAMLRRGPRGTRVPSKMKRPRGGRRNPVLDYREPRHGAAIAREAGRPNRRNQQRGRAGDDCYWRRVIAALEAGTMKVGQDYKTVEMRALAGVAFSSMNLSLALAGNDTRYRLHPGKKNGTYRIYELGK